MRGMGRMALALALVGVGVVLLLREAGVLPEDLRIWPLVVAAAGAGWLLERVASGRGEGYAWPLVLLGVGGLFVLQDLGVVGERISFWPVVLIAVGVAIVLSAVPLAGGGRIALTAESIPVEGATSALLSVAHGAGRLAVGPGHDPGTLVAGTFGGGVQREVRRQGDRLEVSLRQRPAAFADNLLPWNWGRGVVMDWSLAVSRRVPVSMEVRSGASRIDLDLTDLQVGDLLVETGASETEIRLPRTGQVTARVKAGAARLRVRIPDRVAASIRIEGGVSSVRVDEIRFPRQDGRYESRDYESAEIRAEVNLEVGAADVEVR